MVLAAGLGKRMRPLSAITPKPLIPVAGTAMIDRAMAALARADVKRCVVNVHYLADLVEVHAKQFPSMDVVISDERDALLETGGGVTRALPLLGDAPFYLLNSDSFWMEGVSNNLDVLADIWQDDAMDGLLLLSPTVSAVGYEGTGDFMMDAQGHLTRRNELEVSPYVYSGAAIFHPRLFEDAPEGKFSLNLLFDRAIDAGRLFGASMDGTWMHVGTPNSIGRAERAIAESATVGMIG